MDVMQLTKTEEEEYHRTLAETFLQEYDGLDPKWDMEDLRQISGNALEQMRAYSRGDYQTASRIGEKISQLYIRLGCRPQREESDVMISEVQLARAKERFHCSGFNPIWSLGTRDILGYDESEYDPSAGELDKFFDHLCQKMPYVSNLVETSGEGEAKHKPILMYSAREDTPEDEEFKDGEREAEEPVPVWGSNLLCYEFEGKLKPGLFEGLNLPRDVETQNVPTLFISTSTGFKAVFPLDRILDELEHWATWNIIFDILCEHVKKPARFYEEQTIRVCISPESGDRRPAWISATCGDIAVSTNGVMNMAVKETEARQAAQAAMK